MDRTGPIHGAVVLGLGPDARAPVLDDRAGVGDTLTPDNSAIMLSDVEVSSFPTGVPMAERADLLQGTLDLLILKSLILGPLHGWGISKRLRQLSEDVLDVGQGSLYPALYRLEEKGWIKPEWGVSPEGRRAKFYALTPAGKRQFAAERSQWRLFSSALERVLRAT